MTNGASSFCRCITAAFDKSKKSLALARTLLLSALLCLCELRQLAPTLWQFWATRFFVVVCRQYTEWAKCLQKVTQKTLNCPVKYTATSTWAQHSWPLSLVRRQCGHTFCLSAVCLHFCHSDTSVRALSGVCTANARKPFILPFLHSILFLIFPPLLRLNITANQCGNIVRFTALASVSMLCYGQRWRGHRCVITGAWTAHSPVTVIPTLLNSVKPTFFPFALLLTPTLEKIDFFNLFSLLSYSGHFSDRSIFGDQQCAIGESRVLSLVCCLLTTSLRPLEAPSSSSSSVEPFQA